MTCVSEAEIRKVHTYTRSILVLKHFFVCVQPILFFECNLALSFTLTFCIPCIYVLANIEMGSTDCLQLNIMHLVSVSRHIHVTCMLISQCYRSTVLLFVFFPLRPILKVALKCPLFCSSTGHYTRSRGFGLMEKQMIIGMQTCLHQMVDTLVWPCFIVQKAKGPEDQAFQLTIN